MDRRRATSSMAPRVRAARARPSTHPRALVLAAAALAALTSALGLLVATGARGDAPVTPADVVGPVTWGAATRVTRLGDLYFADQPDEAGFAAAREAGVTTVIDLRGPGERAWDERALVEAMGLTYHNVPVDGASFDPAAFARIEALVEQHGSAPILIHCSSSNRVGGWLATHLVVREGMSPEDALAVGRRAGITKPAIEDAVRAHLAARDAE